MTTAPPLPPVVDAELELPPGVEPVAAFATGSCSGAVSSGTSSQSWA